MKNERELPRLPLGFHKLYTFLILPASIVGGGLAAYRHWSALQSMSITSVLDALVVFSLAFPFVCVLLDTLSFVSLVNYRRFGRKCVLFTNTFKALASIASMVTVALKGGQLFDSFVYLAVVACSLLIYLYYLSKSRFFPKGGSTYGELQKTYEESFRIILPVEKEEAPTAEEPEEETASEEEEVEEKVYIPPVVRARTPESKEMRILKKSIITTGSFLQEEPLFIKEISLELLEGGITTISFDVYDRSPKSYVEAEWLLNGKYRYSSETNFFPGDKTTIKAELTEYEDRMHIELLATVDENGNRVEYNRKVETEIMLPEKKALETLSEEEGYLPFLRRYVASSHINAKYLATENGKKNALLCPVCSSPLVEEDRWCPICGISRSDAEKFQAETILEAFHHPKEEEESEND